MHVLHKTTVHSIFYHGAWFRQHLGVRGAVAHSPLMCQRGSMRRGAATKHNWVAPPAPRARARAAPATASSAVHARVMMAWLLSSGVRADSTWLRTSSVTAAGVSAVGEGGVGEGGVGGGVNGTCTHTQCMTQRHTQTHNSCTQPLGTLCGLHTHPGPPACRTRPGTLWGRGPGWCQSPPWAQGPRATPVYVRVRGVSACVCVRVRVCLCARTHVHCTRWQGRSRGMQATGPPQHLRPPHPHHLSRHSPAPHPPATPSHSPSPPPPNTHRLIRLHHVHQVQQRVGRHDGGLDLRRQRAVSSNSKQWL